jgi:hypothetical protein
MGLKTKGLDKQEYLLDPPFKEEVMPKKHYPEQIIATFHSFGIGTGLRMEGVKKRTSGLLEFPSDIIVDLEVEDELNQWSKVISIEDKGDTVIIKAVSREDKKEDKTKYINGIADKIDFKQGLCNEVFIEMLTNVFTEERLNEILEIDDIEILSFNGLMFLKIKDKAYRL